jgi:hypothetical protein
MAPALFLVPRRRRMRRYDDDEDSAYEDDEPIFHRSPVSLENGYRPSSAVYELRFLQDPIDVNDDEEEYSETSSEDDSSETGLENFPAKNIELREARVPLFLRLFLKLLQLMALWLVVSMCLVSISFTVLLTLHHLR